MGDIIQENCKFRISTVCDNLNNAKSEKKSLRTEINEFRLSLQLLEESISSKLAGIRAEIDISCLSDYNHSINCTDIEAQSMRRCAIYLAQDFSAISQSIIAIQHDTQILEHKVKP